MTDTFDADRQCWCGTDVRPACSEGCPALPTIASPPLAPLAPFLPSPAQIRFMRLHAWHLVEKWQWHWLNTMLRATTDRGVTATLWADSVEELIREGLMEAGMGFYMDVTSKGREACGC